MVLTPWIFDLFSHTIPLETYRFFLDSFIEHGWHFVYQLVLIIMKRTEKSLLKEGDMGDVITAIQAYVEKAKWGDLIKDALSEKVDRSDLKQCRGDQTPVKEKNEEHVSFFR